MKKLTFEKHTFVVLAILISAFVAALIDGAVLIFNAKMEIPALIILGCILSIALGVFVGWFRRYKAEEAGDKESEYDEQP